ncbi:MAG: restriction endonuclease subunit S [Magnetococcus sp. YQC-5]
MKWPEEWREVCLLDVCQINPRMLTNERPSSDTQVTFVPMAAVDEERGRIAKPEMRDYVDVANGYTSFREGDILFAKVTPCMENGKAAIVHGLTNGLGFGSTEFHVLRPGPYLLADYIFHFIRQPWFREQAAAAFVGTGGLQRVPPEFFNRVKLPLPPLLEQHRIVEILKEAESIKRLRIKCSNFLAPTKRSLFVNLFGSPSPRINSKWDIVYLGDYVEVATGGTPSRDKSSNFGTMYSWVKSTDLTDSLIENTGEALTRTGLQSCNAKLLPPESILIAMYGQGQTRGRTGKLAIEACCNQACAALLPSEAFYPDYLWVWFQISYDFVRSLGRGGQQENLNLDLIRSIRIPKPPIELQRRFADQLDELHKVEQGIVASSTLKSSLLQHLVIEGFSGSLTVAWREQHRDELSKAARERDAALGLGMPKNRVEITEHAPPERNTTFSRRRRETAIKALSELQCRVLGAVLRWRGAVLADDPSFFEEFCTSPHIIWMIEHLEVSQAEMRRTLEQLAAMGLILKISLPRDNPNTGLTDYLTAFRSFRQDENNNRAEEDVALADVAIILKEINRREQGRGARQ